MVVLEVTISREGDVSRRTNPSGHPLLIEAALEAVRQWKYKPTQLNGQPVEVVSSVEVQITLDNNQGNSG
jgi:periplasmic protein TonB